MGNDLAVCRCNRNPDFTLKRPEKVRALSAEQREHLVDLGRELREKHQGKAKIAVVQKARHGISRQTYHGAPTPDSLRVLQNALTACCRSGADTGQDEFFESDVPRPAIVRCSDPGPPVEASPCSFLGPPPSALDPAPATPSGAPVSERPYSDAYSASAPLVTPLPAQDLERTASKGWRATANTTRSGFGWDVERIKFETKDGELKPANTGITIVCSGSAAQSSASNAFSDDQVGWQGRKDPSSKLFFLGVMCDVPQDVLSIHMLQSPGAEGESNVADEVRVQKLVTNESREECWEDVHTPVQLEGGKLQGIYDANIAPLVPAKRVQQQRTGLAAQAAIRSAAAQIKTFTDRYELGKRLNAGMQGVTYLAKAKFSGRPVVVKKPNDATDTSDFDLLKKKTHPNILRVFEIFEDPLETYIVMEHCEGGDLFHAIERMKAPTQNWSACVFRQVLWGMKYLHEAFNESHNDLKPENIFLDRPPAGPSDVPRAVIGDFGCLKRIGVVGTGGDPRYRAPETFDNPVYGTETDMWSLGVTLYEIVSGGLLIYIDESNTSGWEKFSKSKAWDKFRQKWQKGQKPSLERLGKVTTVEQEDHTVVKASGRPELEQLKALLTGLLQVSPDRRFTVDNALHEPWLHLSHSEKPIPFDHEVADALSRRARRHVMDIALLNLIGGFLQGENLRHYQAIWNKYDVDADGRMWYEEFEKMCKDMDLNAGDGSYAFMKAYNTDSPPNIQDLFLLADVNHSGAIDFKEFVGIMFDTDQLSSEECQQYIKQAFRRLAGADNLLSAEELAGVFECEDAPPDAPEVVQAIFNDMDIDDNGYVDLQEFSKYMDNL